MLHYHLVVQRCSVRFLDAKVEFCRGVLENGVENTDIAFREAWGVVQLPRTNELFWVTSPSRIALMCQLSISTPSPAIFDEYTSIVELAASLCLLAPPK